ncbi:MAG: hypothetical protein JW990_05565 [Thermoleophilia bacterium]|nr:hypothetical protein [Thermoleophilia bacterium]
MSSFQDDGTLNLVMEGLGEFSVDYELSGGRITIDMMGEKTTAPYRLDGDTITISPEGEPRVVFTRSSCSGTPSRRTGLTGGPGVAPGPFLRVSRIGEAGL